jgi:predicted nucleotidyltransferase
MDKAEVIEIAQEYARRANALFKIKRIFLYGSAARGETKENSDIDIAVVVDHIDGDFIDAKIRLYHIRRDVDDGIEPILINESSDRSGFLEEIKKTGILPEE